MNPKRLLIYRFGQLGDTVAALPSLWLLRQQYPDIEFTLLSEVPQKENHLGPEHVLPSALIQTFIKYRGGSKLASILSQLKTLLKLRWQGYDTLVYLVPSIRTPRQRQRDAWFFRLVGIRQKWGLKGFPDEPYPRDPEARLKPVIAEADALLQRLAQDGLPEISPGGGSMDLAISASENKRVADWWQRQDGPAKAPRGWFALCCGSKWSSKQWPEQRYREVGRRLIDEHGLLPLIFGGPEDRQLGERLIADWGCGLCAAGELQVRESAALLQQARFYLGNDTGVMHLAAAVGRPCVGVFAAIDWPGRWHPYGKGHEVLRVEVPCGGCFQATCPLNNECLTEISVEEVYQACCRVIQRLEAEPEQANFG